MLYFFLIVSSDAWIFSIPTLYSSSTGTESPRCHRWLPSDAKIMRFQLWINNNIGHTVLVVLSMLVTIQTRLDSFNVLNGTVHATKTGLLIDASRVPF